MTHQTLPIDMSSYQTAFSAIERDLNGAKNSPIHALRQKGFLNFNKLGLPSTKNEDWKYTDLSLLTRTDFKPTLKQAEITKDHLDPLLQNIENGHLFVFVDGHYSPTLLNERNTNSLPAGASFASIKQMMQQKDKAGATPLPGNVGDIEKNPIIAKNSAFFTDGASINISSGYSLEQPIYLIFISGSAENSSSYPRVCINVEAGAKASVVELYLGSGNNQYLSNGVTEISIAKEGRLEHVKLGLHGSEAIHLGHTAIKMEGQSYYRSNCFTFGGKIVRNEISPTLNGEGVECHLNGLTVVGNDQHIDNHTVIDHAKPHCHSNELYKGVYNDNATGAFSGTIIVRPDAQKTDAIQSNQTLLLSPTASIKTRPQLKIWADDVKCTHGATVGQLDDMAMFYLRSRGIDKKIAEKILIKAFAHELLDSFPITELSPLLEDKLSQALS